MAKLYDQDSYEFRLTTNLKGESVTKKRKYGTKYNDFIAYVNKELFDNGGNDFGGIGDDVFLLPDFRNSQFGDQSFTLVNRFAEPIKGTEGSTITINTIEFDKKNAIDTEELRKQSLNNAFNSRLIKIANSKNIYISKISI